MSIVLTNGEYYIVSLKNGEIGKTKDIDKAQALANVIFNEYYFK